MVITLIISHLVALVAGGYLGYRYGKKVAGKAQSELNSMKNVAGKVVDNLPKQL